MIRQMKEDSIPISEENFEYVREMKEQMCQSAYDFEQEMVSPDPLSEEDRSYELPDGKGIIQVDHRKRFNSTEILFNPDLCGSQEKGLAHLAFSSIEKCDSDLKINLYSNIVLAGGSTIMPGFYERFDKEIKKLGSNYAKSEINVYADLQRKFASW